MIKLQKKFIPVMLTPFKHDGTIDFKLLTRLTEFYINAGAQGLFANCLSSEMYELTPNERISITKHVVDVVDGALPVVSTGSFGNDLNDQIDFINKIYETGVNSVILSSGVMVSENESDAEFEHKFNEILNATKGINFGFYECPVPYKRIVSPELLSRFVKTGRVNYFKDTSLDLDMVKEKIKVGVGFDFGLYDAYIVHAVESLKSGSAGLSCIQGNFFPELIVWLCNNYNKAELTKEVASVQQFLSSKMDVMHDVYPTVAKIYLKKRGLEIKNISRRDVGKVTTKDMANLDTLFSDYSKLRNSLEIPNAM
jgi:4-hydroxy-tetrahydrodipicolinate synthase